eukprot:3005407-Rhodomonas_salina.1
MMLCDVRYRSIVCCAVCGTNLAYDGMRRAVLSKRMMVCCVRYSTNICCYAACGTKLVYAGTWCA